LWEVPRRPLASSTTSPSFMEQKEATKLLCERGTTERYRFVLGHVCKNRVKKKQKGGSQTQPARRVESFRKLTKEEFRATAEITSVAWAQRATPRKKVEVVRPRFALVRKDKKTVSRVGKKEEVDGKRVGDERRG